MNFKHKLILDSIVNRVLISLGLLGGAKMLNVCVPFLFKGAIDSLNILQMGTPVETTAAVITSMLLGCNILFLIQMEIFNLLQILKMVLLELVLLVLMN
jgi:hypothetical protein